MPSTFVKGDLFAATDLAALAHGCNCAGAMGKGIAVQFKERFPAMYAEYWRRCADGLFRPGDVFIWNAPSGVTVFNLGTQKTWNTRATLPAVAEALHKMTLMAGVRGIKRIGLPRIGAGLGGLPWEDVKAELVLAGEKTLVELVVFEEYEPALQNGPGSA